MIRIRTALLVSCLMLVATGAADLRAQSACDINNVHTNPDPKYVRPAAGSGNPAHWTNHFDWMKEYWLVRWAPSPNDVFFCPPAVNGDPEVTCIKSPFYSNFEGVLHLNNSTLRDYHPQDGWELVSRDFGMENSTEPIRRSGAFGSVRSQQKLRIQ